MLSQNVSLALALAGCAVACQHPAERTDAVEPEVDAWCQAERCVSPIFGENPGGFIGGGSVTPGTDGGFSLDADGGVASVHGQLFVTSVVPLSSDPRTLVATDGWRVESALGSAPLPSAVTADGGAYAFDDVPVFGGAMVLRAESPSGRDLGVLLAAAPTAASVNLIAVPTTVFETGAANAGYSLQAGRAHLIVQVGDTAATMAGTTLDFADGTVASLAYDSDTSGTLRPTPPTGMHGTAVAFNIQVPASGVVSPRLTRGAASAAYLVPVQADHVTWLVAAPP